MAFHYMDGCVITFEQLSAPFSSIQEEKTHSFISKVQRHFRLWNPLTD